MSTQAGAPTATVGTGKHLNLRTFKSISIARQLNPLHVNYLPFLLLFDPQPFKPGGLFKVTVCPARKFEKFWMDSLAFQTFYPPPHTLSASPNSEMANSELRIYSLYIFRFRFRTYEHSIVHTVDTE